jgi:hypothetical protein
LDLLEEVVKMQFLIHHARKDVAIDENAEGIWNHLGDAAAKREERPDKMVEKKLKQSAGKERRSPSDKCS